MVTSLTDSHRHHCPLPLAHNPMPVFPGPAGTYTNFLITLPPPPTSPARIEEGQHQYKEATDDKVDKIGYQASPPLPLNAGGLW